MLASRPDLKGCPVGAAVVTYGASDTGGALVALLEESGIPVALVDNGPASIYSHLATTVISGQGNVGFGQGVNLAFRRLMTLYPEMQKLLVANPDVMPSPEAVRFLASGSRATRGAILAFPYVDATGASIRDRAILPSPTAHLFQAFFGEAKALSRWPARTYPKGACFVIDTDLFEDLSGFDDRFFLYYEETDLFRRALAAGAVISWAPESAAVYHAGGESINRYPKWTAVELGRSGGVYASSEPAVRRYLFLASAAAQYVLLTLRLAATRRLPESIGSAFALAGLTLGSIAPTLEPLRLSRLRPIPYTSRRALRRVLFPSPPDGA